MCLTMPSVAVKLNFRYPAARWFATPGLDLLLPPAKEVVGR